MTKQTKVNPSYLVWFNVSVIPTSMGTAQTENCFPTVNTLILLIQHYPVLPFTKCKLYLNVNSTQ